MNQKIVFTSDPYFGQTNIIRLIERPFASVEEMDLELIKRRNEKIGAKNIIYNLYDIPLAKYRCF
jgi:calcineurin-like phosphoesterase family protein